MVESLATMASEASAEVRASGPCCRVCGATNLIACYTKPFGTLARCPDCELLLLVRPGDEDSNLRVQQETFGTDWVEFRRKQQRVTCRDAHRRLADIQRYASGGSLLEIGCGTGELLAVAEQRGFQVTGIDSSSEALEHARACFGLGQLFPSLSSLSDSKAHFDVVVMSHVLEHLYYPVQTLQQIQVLLRPGGILYVAVPNLDDWGVGILGGDWPDFHPAHVTHFNFRTLSRLLIGQGFKVLGGGRPASAGIALSVLNFFKFKVLGRKEPLPDGSPRACLSPPQRLSMKALHASARLAHLGLTVALYPVGLLQVRWGKTGELVVLAQKTPV